ncbi:diguanylate phosphodiesterase [Turneriella parva DSM 21527]|uniref:Diguanylate phosphodiesterase n=1 Tax=Turneriella parva (strain ATCC BAA-1111 / DSM 21527 / NCTC 11395 / H) TaxID=869212 RepID=I4B963_TURPD|nr:diguanylate phosphodiesterase [Turneriella parva DSM 21527]
MHGRFSENFVVLVTEGGNIELSRLDPALAGNPFPYFQPIISIEDKRVVGYEVLARGRDALGNITSLGYMFEKYADSRVAIELDLYIRDLAFKQYSESQIAFGKRLFVNILPRWLNYTYSDDLSDVINPLLQQVAKHRLKPENVVIEITEGEYLQHPDVMTRAIHELKNHGFDIAIDDFGAGYSNMSRIGQMRPKFIKLDLHLIRKGFSDLVYKEILNSLAFLSEKIGAVLLVEGIEHEEEVYGALDIGARYLQGYFLGFPEASFSNLDELQQILHDYMRDFTARKLTHMQSLMYFKSITSEYFDVHLKELFLPEVKDGESFFRPIEPHSFPAFLRDHLRLVYFLNAHGVQISPNYRLLRDDDGFRWQQDHNYSQKDWSWRPYFLEFMARRESDGTQRNYSEVYRDIKSSEPIVTLVHSYGDDCLLCLDFSVAHIHNPLWHRKI